MFVDAFAARDFMTVFLVLHPDAQFRFQRNVDLLQFDALVSSPDDAIRDEFLDEAVGDLGSWEHRDVWALFDRLMPAAIPAEVAGIEGTTTFVMQQSGSGRWRVLQVIVPDGDVEQIPWSVR